MPNSRQGSIRLFNFSGIDVFLHWSWFLVAAFEISNRNGSYSSRGWNVLEYLALFGIVMLHEFGHALACRQVGGIANQIVLWPLGGVAYVNPPPRAGATLWSIAAGPLVNVVFIPVLYTIGMLSRSLGDGQTLQDVRVLVHSVWIINLVLLGFNLLPVYPLDGGQIFRSLLWFMLGRGAQPDGGNGGRLYRRNWFHCVGVVDEVYLAGICLGVYVDELLGRMATRARLVAAGEVAAAGGLRLSAVQGGGADWRSVAVRAVPARV